MNKQRIKKIGIILLLLSISLASLMYYRQSNDNNPKIDKKILKEDEWNDPTDPNYHPEGYNPLEGIWRFVRGDEDLSDGICFNKDFTLRYLAFYSATGDDSDVEYKFIHLKPYYKFNDKAFELLNPDTGVKELVTYELENEQQTLIIYWHDELIMTYRKTSLSVEDITEPEKTFNGLKEDR